jgi:hypothetical protein
MRVSMNCTPHWPCCHHLLNKTEVILFMVSLMMVKISLSQFTHHGMLIESLKHQPFLTCQSKRMKMRGINKKTPLTCLQQECTVEELDYVFQSWSILSINICFKRIECLKHMQRVNSTLVQSFHNLSNNGSLITFDCKITKTKVQNF